MLAFLRTSQSLWRNREYVGVTMELTERKQAEQERERLRHQVITYLLSRCIIGQAKPKWS